MNNDKSIINGIFAFHHLTYSLAYANEFIIRYLVDICVLICVNTLRNFYNDMIYRLDITIFINAIELNFKL